MKSFIASHTIPSVIEALMGQSANGSLKKIARSAWLVAGVLFAAYLYFVGAITFSVVAQEALAQDITTLRSQASIAELQYLESQKSFTEAEARALGFIDPQELSYAATAPSVAFNTDETR